MEKHILISVIERDICTTEFNSLEDARERMINELLESVGYDTIEELEEDGYLKKEEDYDLYEYSAWVNGNHSENYDWKIIAV